MDSERDNTSVSNEDSEEDEELVVSSTAHQVKCAETKLKPDISLESSLPCDPLQLEPYTTNGDPEQLERDKQAVYSHPMFPLLALLYEKCEIATQSINSFDRDSSLSSFNNEIEEFIEHQKRLGKPFFTNNAEVDSLMIRAIQVFRIHLLELEKVSELCKDFCQRYISCLRTKMRSDVLIRGGSSSDGNEMMSSVSFEDKETRVLLNELNHNLFASYPGSFTSSVSSCTSSSASSRSSQITSSHVVNSPPSSPSLSHCSSNTGQMQDSDGKSPEARSPSSPSPPPPSQLALTLDPVISTLYNFPLAAKYNLSLAGLTDTIPTESSFQSFLTPEDGIVQDLSLKNKSTSSSQSSPLREPNLFQPVADKSTCNGSSAHQPNVKLTSTKGSKRGDKMSSGVHSKRGVLPKQATSIMRSWLFQHIVHPYPTEDEKRAIASQTNLTLLQVNNWFINARRRILQPMLDSANTLHGELINNNGRELDLSLKIKARGANSRKLKAQSQQLHRLWPQSLANLIQTGDLNPKS